jgi:predicted DNA-binding transcriptional regulator YafY
MADYFEVSTRTIERDLSALQQAGVLSLRITKMIVMKKFVDWPGSKPLVQINGEEVR